MSKTPYFGPELFQFLEGLRANNDRGWFQANKARYESCVRQPFLRFIGDLDPLLRRIRPCLQADPRPTGGSLFRIHRDTRFAKDKSPYKTHAGAYFSRREVPEGVHAPGLTSDSASLTVMSPR